MCRKARQGAPTVLFIDEIDSLVSARYLIIFSEELCSSWQGRVTQHLSLHLTFVNLDKEEIRAFICYENYTLPPLPKNGIFFSS
jgi:hypothetical protein